MATPKRTGGKVADQLRLEGEVVGLWFEMQARLEGHFTELAARHGLSAVQAKVLLQLQPDGAVTMRTLAGQLKYDASNLTGVVDRLEEMGAVRRQPQPHDRRAKGVLLTREGQRLRQAFWERLTNKSGPLGRLNSRDLTSLRALLRSAMGDAGSERLVR
ncbi:MAG: MarR family transcriptional regulator [Candidatus Dormibacteraeota bacterium]|nr:MarR family transcriptional regulator [Candidatus Dormibacteraeota bacterium]